jgi:cephalosporin-C deacetylase-like acetyl esterase
MRVLAAFLLSCCVGFAGDAQADLLRWMDDIAQQQLAKRVETVAKIQTKEDAVKRQAFVRAKVLELIGGIPDYSGPLHAVATGHIDQPGFVIEKVLFESWPGLFVTANLYRPDKPGRFPAVLLPLGHWEYGKPAVQVIAGNLALKGFVVLTYDPIGQGERQQAYDRRIEASLLGGSTEQHFLAGAKDILIGRSFARDRIFDGVRALDYLVTRSEVDKDRIGVTGCSGGGTLSTYIAALDPRVKVAAPTCYITSFRDLFRGAVGDSEQSIPGFISSGLDQVDYVESFAPKPWLIGSTEEDFFPIAGSKMAYEEARGWYKMFGAEDRLKWVVGPGGHGTPLVVREAIYGWMIRWLNNGEGSSKEQDVPVLPEFKLWVTQTGQVSDLPGSRDIYDVIRERFEKERTQGTKEDLSKALLQWMADPEGATPFGTVTREIMTPRSGGKHQAVLLVDTRQNSALREKAGKLVGAGNIVEILLPRGEPDPQETSRQFSGAWIMNTRAWLIGANLPGMRARDIIDGVSILAGRPDVDVSNIRAEARGIAGVWLLMAAAVDSRIKAVAVNSTPYSLRAAIEEPLARDLHDAVIPGFALRWDLIDLVSLIEPRKVAWTDPMDWTGHVKPLPGEYRYTPAEQ